MTVVFLCAAVTVVALAWAWAFGRKASESRAKTEVYREFAETFGALVPVCSIKDKEAKKRESTRHYMRLALVDPLMRDGLRAALVEADEFWHNEATA